jgi:hypothetical protein
MSEMNDHPHDHDEDNVGPGPEIEPVTQISENPHGECERMIQMQGVTINSLQSRIFQLEMEIVDLLSASNTQRAG